MKTAIQLILNERRRQVEIEGWSLDHDDNHTDGELAAAAATYADPANYHGDFPLYDGSGEAKVLIPRTYRWPFGKEWFKPSPENRIRELAKAGALILAEMERLQRKEYNQQWIDDEEASHG